MEEISLILRQSRPTSCNVTHDYGNTEHPYVGRLEFEH